jgi:hypothetical protein
MKIQHEPPVFATLQALVDERTRLTGRLQALAEQVAAALVRVESIDAQLVALRHAVAAERVRRAGTTHQSNAAPMRH